MSALRERARALRKEGFSPCDVLRDLVAEGYEYPDAEWAVISELRLDQESIDEMRGNYDECA